MRINKHLIAVALQMALAHSQQAAQNTDVLKTKRAPTKNQAKAKRRKK